MFYAPTVSAPPTIDQPKLADPLEAERWAWVARAWRLLYGRWRPDLEQRVKDTIGTVRRGAWRQVDLSANLFRQGWDAIAKRYDLPPTVEHDDETGRRLIELVKLSGYWSRMKRIQRDTLGLREMLVRIDVSGGRLVYRSLTPGEVQARGDYDRPDEPCDLYESRPRLLAGVWKYCWDHVSIDTTDGQVPIYALVDQAGEPVPNPPIGGPYVGEAYPYRWTQPKPDDAAATGKPFLPYVVYHASDTGKLWDSESMLELIEGTYNSAVYWSCFGHVVRQSSWQQRYTIDLTVASAVATDEDEDEESVDDAGGTRSEVVTDPASILQLFSTPDAQGQPSVGTFAAPSDPLALVEAVERNDRRLTSYMGINGADQMKMSGDPRSGYAVAVSRDSQRDIQRSGEPTFMRADLEVLEKSAALLNRAGLGPFPESGYRIRYNGIPLSAEERDALRRDVIEKLNARLISPVQAYLTLNPGSSVKEAEEVAKGGASAPMVGIVSVASEAVQAVAAKALPRDSAVALLAYALQVDESVADKIVASAGREFKPPAPPPMFGGGGPPPPPGADDAKPDDDEEGGEE